MAKEKKQLTTKQQQNKFRGIGLSCFIGEFISLITPFVTIGIVNYDKYFVEYNGTKMSISFFVALATMGVAIFLVSKKKLENSMVTLLIGWGIAAFVFTLMGELITELSTIMWFGLIGLAGSFGLDKASKSAYLKANRIKEAIKKAQDEEIIAQYKKEQNNDAEEELKKDEVKAGGILG